MPQTTATIADEPSAIPCPNCGTAGQKAVKVCAASGVLGWQGCEFCAQLVLARHQLEIVKDLVRAAEAKEERRRQ